MARRGPGIVRAALATLKGLVVVVALVVLAILAFVAYAQKARKQRETATVEAIAATVPDGRGRWIPAGDVSIHVQEWGRETDPVVVLVHGTGAWSGTWFEVPSSLAAHGWRVVALDLPPFGLTKYALDDGTLDYRRDAQASRILAVVASLRQPVTLVGHSFGAGPALQAALRSDTLRALVLVDPALGLGSGGEAPRCTDAPLVDALLAHRAVRTALVGATATWPDFTPALLRSFVHRKARIDGAHVPSYRIPFARRGFSADLGDWAATFAHANCEQAESLDPERLRAWSATHAPVRLIWGAEDDITPLAQARALESWLFRSTLDVIPGVGHIPHVEDPAAFDAVLSKALGAP